MKQKKESPVDTRFDPSISDRERACFEAGIKLGAIFHSILSFPVLNDKEVLTRIENGFRSSFKIQPYVKDLQIRIKIPDEKKFLKANEFDYTIIKDFMIDVELILEYKGITVHAVIKWVPELEYPLMAIRAIHE
nr:dihydroneopterin aldolase family protein [Candidatus Sigynarchaeota archaeon]